MVQHALRDAEVVVLAVPAQSLRDNLGDLRGKRICICGDVLHSRVARSNIWGLTKLGAEVAVCGPRSLLPSSPAWWMTSSRAASRSCARRCLNGFRRKSR